MARAARRPASGRPGEAWWVRAFPEPRFTSSTDNTPALSRLGRVERPEPRPVAQLVLHLDRPLLLALRPARAAQIDQGLRATVGQVVVRGARHQGAFLD